MYQNTQRTSTSGLHFKAKTKFWRIRHCLSFTVKDGWITGIASGLQKPITLTICLNGSVHFLEYFLNLIFWTTVKLWITNMCHHSKFHHNRSNCCADIAIFEMAAVNSTNFLQKKWKRMIQVHLENDRYMGVALRQVRRTMVRFFHSKLISR